MLAAWYEGSITATYQLPAGYVVHLQLSPPNTEPLSDFTIPRCSWSFRFQKPLRPPPMLLTFQLQLQ
ncbi:hypothetical protein VNO80_14003 [Phaseolus coccineus]|uniref:Uncharacterized protein n=1 Tax=Phaseolus coccineus TaxID=3886 RepID=A0AAN9RAD9_PHACN